MEDFDLEWKSDEGFIGDLEDRWVEELSAAVESGDSVRIGRSIGLEEEDTTLEKSQDEALRCSPHFHSLMFKAGVKADPKSLSQLKTLGIINNRIGKSPERLKIYKEVVGYYPAKYIKVRFMSAHGFFKQYVDHHQKIEACCEEFGIEEYKEMDVDYLRKIVEKSNVIVRGLRYFEASDSSMTGSLIPSCKHIMVEMTEDTDEIETFCDGVFKRAQKYYKLMLRNPRVQDCLTLDPTLDESKYLNDIQAKASYERLNLNTSVRRKLSYLHELTTPTIDILSDLVTRALEGVASIEDFLENPRYKRRREILLTLANACRIERANCDLRLSLNFNQARMSDEILTSKLVLRCCSDTLAYFAIKAVLRDVYVIEEAGNKAKKSKTHDRVQKILAKINET